MNFGIEINPKAKFLHARDKHFVVAPVARAAGAVEPTEGIGGSWELSFNLKDGWMLTEVGSKVDTQADETINSVANVIKEAGGLA